MPGVQNLKFYNSMQEHKLFEHILVTSEQNANYIACGNYLNTKKMNVIVNLVSPGLLHSTEGIEYAYKNRIPLFIIVTSFDENNKFGNQLHEIDNLNLVRDIAKTIKIHNLSDVVEAYNFCVENLTPVVIEIPTNIYDTEVTNFDIDNVKSSEITQNEDLNINLNNISLTIGYNLCNTNHRSCFIEENDLKKQCMELLTATKMNIPMSIESNCSDELLNLFNNSFSYNFIKNNEKSVQIQSNVIDKNIDKFEEVLISLNIDTIYLNNTIDILFKKLKTIKLFNNLSLFFTSYGYNSVAIREGKISCVILTYKDDMVSPSGLAEAYQDNVPLLLINLTENEHSKFNFDTLTYKQFNVVDFKEGIDYALMYKCPVMINYNINSDDIFNVKYNLNYEKIAINNINSYDFSELISDINRSKLPLIYFGNTNVSQKLAIDFANQVDSLVSTTFSGKGIYPEKEKRWLWCGLSNAIPNDLHEIMNDIDLIIMVGGKLSEVVSGHFRHYNIENTKTYHININKNDFYYKSKPILCDATIFITKLLESVPKQTNGFDFKNIQEIQKNITEELNFETDKTSPFNILSKISSDSIVVCDSGNSMLHCCEQLRLNSPHHFFGPFDYSCMGFSIPVSIGISNYNSEQLITCVVGDGAFRMNYSELQTIVNNNLNIMIIIFNDGELNMMSTIQRLAYNSTYEIGLPELNIDSLCKMFGIKYYEYDNNTNLNECVKPCLVNCLIDYSKPPLFVEGLLYSKPLKKQIQPIEAIECDIFSIIDLKKNDSDITVIDEYFNISMSYKDIHNQCCKLYTYYKKINVNEQNVIAVVNNNSYHNIVFHFAIAGLNCILLNINTRLTANEMNYIFENANAKYLISSVEFKNKITHQFDDILWIEDDYVNVMQKCEPSIIKRNKDVSDLNYQLYYTSGTTGKPKGVLTNS